MEDEETEWKRKVGWTEWNGMGKEGMGEGFVKRKKKRGDEKEGRPKKEVPNSIKKRDLDPI